MSRFLAVPLLTVCCLALALSGSASADDDKQPAAKPRSDANGDPLPPAALARLGTLRLVHGPGLTSLAFSKDDKTLYSIGTQSVRAWDPVTGKETGGFAFAEDDRINATAASHDARFLACASDNGFISIRDLHTGKTYQRFATDNGPAQELAFSPDGRFVVWSANYATVHVTELAGDRPTRTFKAAQHRVRRLSMSTDGKWLAGLFENHEAVMLWDVVSGKRMRQYSRSGSPRRGGESIMAAVLAPDGKSLYATSSEGQILAWDTDSLEERYQVDVTPRRLVSLTLSPDGKTLCAGLNTGGFELYQAQTGKAVRTLEGECPPNATAAFSRDGKTLAVADDSRVRLWDVTTGKEKQLVKGEGIVAAAFASQGKRIVTSAPGQIVHWSPSGKVEGRVKLAEEHKLLVPHLSPCGRFALISPPNLESRLIDTQKAEPRKDFTGVTLGRNVAFAFHPAGQSLAVLDNKEGDTVTLYSPQTGKKVREWKTALEGTTSTTLLFSPDGRTLFTPHPLSGQLQRWELATGKKRQAFQFPAGARRSNAATYGRVSDLDVLARGGAGGGLAIWLDAGDITLRGAGNDVLAVSPDGRLVAVLRDERVCLCDAWQGKLVRSLQGAQSSLDCLAFSPDGKLIAAGADEKVWLWQVTTGKRVAALAGHRGRVASVTFSPDGKALLSCSADGTALLWSVAEALRLPEPVVAKRKPRSLEELWAELVSDDGEAAELAGREMAAKPEASAWLAKHVAPAAPIDRAALARLVALLDDENVAVREDATRRLVALDGQARAAVEAAQKADSAEVRKRAGLILGRMGGEVTGVEARAMRAVEVLEAIGDGEAKKALTRLARGAAEARLTKEAAAALERLEARE